MIIIITIDALDERESMISSSVIEIKLIYKLETRGDGCKWSILVVDDDDDAQSKKDPIRKATKSRSVMMSLAHVNAPGEQMRKTIDRPDIVDGNASRLGSNLSPQVAAQRRTDGLDHRGLTAHTMPHSNSTWRDDEIYCLSSSESSGRQSSIRQTLLYRLSTKSRRSRRSK